MQYLAEVQKKGGGVFGGAKAELKLLACQKNEQTWTIVPNEEIRPVPSEEVNNLNHGQLVLVEVSGTQVKKVQEASSRIVGWLQNYSRQIDKSKTQEEEIQQWQESLRYQTGEINRRERELEDRLAQYQDLEDDIKRLEAELGDLSRSRSDNAELQSSLASQRVELEAAWEQLRVEQSKLEQLKIEAKGGGVIDELQGAKIQELLTQLSESIPPTELVREELNQAFERLNSLQQVINPFWEQIEQQKSEAQDKQARLDQLLTELSNYFIALEDAQSLLVAHQAEYVSTQKEIEVNQEYFEILKTKLQGLEEIYQQIYSLAFGSCHDSKVNLEALENMPLDELAQLVNSLHQDLEKYIRFVNEQEQELTYQDQDIQELKEQIAQATEFDRLDLENRLSEQLENYKMLDATLVPQRHTLQEREETYNLHFRILRRRQGISDPVDSSKINLEPVLADLEQQKQVQKSEIEALEQKIEVLVASLNDIEERFNRQQQEVNDLTVALRALQEDVPQQQAIVTDLWTKLNIFQEVLQPIQDRINLLWERLEGGVNSLAQVQEVSYAQLQSVAEMQQILMPLIVQN